MSMALDWYENGPKCMNCGERVMDAERILSEEGLVLKGICKSTTCRKLPPGGNPFMYMWSSGDEEE
jgi:hypothetical protein